MIWLIVALGAIVTFFAVSTGVIGIQSATVTRRSEPGLYWSAVALSGGGTIVLAIMAILGGGW